MSADVLAQLVEVENWWILLKWVYVGVYGLYGLFSLVVLAQIKQMIGALTSEFDGTLKLIGVIHMLIAMGAFLLAIVVL